MANQEWKEVFRYGRTLPTEAAIKSLSSEEYARTTKAKREGKAKGKQFVKQPKGIAKKTAKYR